MEWAEEVRAEQEGKMERALAALSFLAIFSALIDGCDYLQTLIEDFMGEGHLNIIVPSCIVQFYYTVCGDKSADEFQRSYIQKKKKEQQ